jgi:hypothetical protein
LSGNGESKTNRRVEKKSPHCAGFFSWLGQQGAPPQNGHAFSSSAMSVTPLLIGIKLYPAQQPWVHAVRNAKRTIFPLDYLKLHNCRSSCYTEEFESKPVGQICQAAH